MCRECCTNGGGDKNAYGILIGSPEEKRTFVTQRRRW